MTIKRLIINLLVIPLFLATPTYAATDSTKALQDEIIYRVHLGRASDVKFLLDKGASVNFTNPDGVPLLSLAAERTDEQSIPVMQVLLDGGAEVNAQDTTGQTALFHAARVNNKKAVEFLLGHGIDYYMVDNNGDVARNIAHNEGYDDLVKAMDSFVVEQSKKVNEQYKEYNRVLQERYDEQRRIVEEREKAMQEAAYQSAGTSQKMEKEYNDALAEMERIERERQQAVVEKRNSTSFQEDLSSLAYHMCAFQYWSYCRELRQTTEIKDDALNNTIDTHYNNVVMLTNTLVTEYALEKPYLDGVTDRAKRRIFVELEGMPSPTYRFEHGVGKLDDVKKRCERVARYWNMELSDDEKNFGKKNKKNGTYDPDEN